MTELEKELRVRIATDGPLPIAEYMTLCLTHPNHGYYTSGRPLGGRGSANREGGDFITAPEVSQMFGEMIGVWCMEIWQALGSPSFFNLVEIGPGRGTLMRDLLRVSRALPQFQAAANIYLIEVSPALAEQQSLLLSDDTKQIKWIRDITALPDGPCIIIGNELLDALPFRQWVKQGENWHERAIGLVEDQLAFVMRPATLDKSGLPAHHEKEPDGMIFEAAPAREGFVGSLADHLARHTGAALMIDYGHFTSGFGDTFQAIQKHAFVDPLSTPGKADLTSHVDFEPLVRMASSAGCAVAPLTTQGEFLLRLGLLERAANLGRERGKAPQSTLQSAVERLAAPDQMGDLFKVLVFGLPAHILDSEQDSLR